MASRKTYFGIGWPKDPSDAVPGPPGTREPEDRSAPTVIEDRSAPTVIEDRSAPTVVDDEKVAEGLKQLRSWYQGDARQDQNASDGSPAPYAPQENRPAEFHARPTAVGHASGSAPAMPRPIAPDPMRATMYGHDVHQFEFPPGTADTTPTPQQPPHQPPPAASTALVVADPSVRSREMFRQQAQAAPGAVGRSTQLPFQLADHGEAQRLVRPGGQKPTPYPPPSSVARVPLASKIVFASGIAALTGAVLIWLLSGNEPETASAPAPRPAAVVQTPPPPAPIRPLAPTPTATPTAAPIPARAPAAAPAVQPPPLPARTAIAPARPVASPSLRAPGSTPEPIPLVTEPKSDRPARVRRQKAVEVPQPAADGEDVTTAVATSPQAEKEPPATDPKDPRELKEAKDTKDVKAAKDSKETKSAKEPKARPGDPDAPLPPSSLD
jgi:hypothetical protein